MTQILLRNDFFKIINKIYLISSIFIILNILFFYMLDFSIEKLMFSIAVLFNFLAITLFVSTKNLKAIKFSFSKIYSFFTFIMILSNMLIFYSIESEFYLFIIQMLNSTFLFSIIFFYYNNFKLNIKD